MFNQRRAGVFELDKLFIALTKFFTKFSYGGEYRIIPNKRTTPNVTCSLVVVHVVLTLGQRRTGCVRITTACQVCLQQKY